MEEKEFIKKMMQEAVGISDEDFEKYMSFPHNAALAKSTPEFMKYKIVAEVTDSKYCTAGLKKGQKYTFQSLPAVMLPEETTCPVCARALPPIGNIIGEIWEEIASGNLKGPKVVECLDPGVEKGGLGHIIFKVYAQKKD